MPCHNISSMFFLCCQGNNIFEWNRMGSRWLKILRNEGPPKILLSCKSSTLQGPCIPWWDASDQIWLTLALQLKSRLQLFKVLLLLDSYKDCTPISSRSHRSLGWMKHERFNVFLFSMSHWYREDWSNKWYIIIIMIHIMHNILYLHM